MLDLIASILVRGLNIVLNFIPIEFNLWIGRRLGSIGFMMNKKRRMIAYANLKAAFAKEKSPQELRAITKKVYVNLVQTFTEIACLTKVSKPYVNKYVEVVNMPRIEDAAKTGRGTILLTAHFGDWELSSLVSAMKGFPITVLAREQKMKRLNELLNRLRESKGCKVVRKGLSTKLIFRELYKNNMVGILSDQDAGKNGTFVEFFGRPTSAHMGPFEIAKHTDSVILPNFIVRTRGPYHKLYLEDYIETRDVPEDRLKECLQKYMSLLEKYIRQYPDQWLWLHKRWKSTPKRSIIVLSDGKAGHLNQSLAVALQIRRARMTQGYTMEDTSVSVIKVEYKNKFLRLLLALTAPLANWRCHGRMYFMRLCLTEKSYNELMGSYAEFIVSCGSSLAGVNIFMKKENNARNVVVMKPGMFCCPKKFNFMIVPKHDRIKARKNVIVTSLAPNLMDAASLKKAADTLREKVRIEGKKVIGLLIGGDNREFRMPAGLLRKVLSDVLRICELSDADLLVTTSRRTNQYQEAVIKSMFHEQPRCKLLVVANENNPDGTLAGILAYSDAVVVSGESISMISEAIASGKKTVAFSLERKKGSSAKHERVIDSLARDGLLSVARAGELISLTARALKDTTPPRKIGDNEKIYEAMRALI